MINPLFTIFLPALFFYMIFRAHHDIIRYHRIRDEKLPVSFEGFTIFFISDIHRRQIRNNTLKEIKKNIDIVIIGGDLTEKGVPLRRVQKNLRKLKGLQAPIYFVWGNNDLETNVEKLSALLLKEKINILANEYVEIQRGKDTVRLIGLDYYQSDKDQLLGLFPETADRYVFMAVHVPSSFIAMPKDMRKKANMVFAGHTHGGQIRIFDLGPYEKGYTIKLENTNILISEGYGCSVLPMRLGTNAECHVISFFQS